MIAQRKPFSHDDRGAVMIMGLFMGLSLIGSLWYIIGIGDAVVFRDRMQEAADAVAYSSATVHARGMNMIAAINLIIFALTALYMIMAVIDTLLVFLCHALEICAATTLTIVADFTGIPEICDGLLPEVEEFHDTYHEIWAGYCAFYGTTVEGASILSSAVAMGAPYGGLAAGLMVGSDYDQTGVAFSTSMAPGFALTGGNPFSDSGGGKSATSGADKGKFNGTGIDVRLGLPVTNESLKQECLHTAQYVGEALRDTVKKIPVLGSILGIGPVWGIVEDQLGKALQSALCPRTDIDLDLLGNPSEEIPWEGMGAKKMWDPGKNGTDWMQVWGFVLNPDFVTAAGNSGDTSENKVSLASNKGQGGLGVTAPAVPDMYVAQAEFYLDCREKWEDFDCNGASESIQNLTIAAYSVKWRARLRRVRTPDIGGMVEDYLGQILSSSNVTSWLRGQIKGSKAFKGLYSNAQKLAQKYGGGLGGSGQQWTRKAFAFLIKEEGGIDTAVNAGKNAAGKHFTDDPNPPKMGAYH